jgi:hypothetical protein
MSASTVYVFKFVNSNIKNIEVERLCKQPRNVIKRRWFYRRYGVTNSAE